jgi:hypothetical protein
MCILKLIHYIAARPGQAKHSIISITWVKEIAVQTYNFNINLSVIKYTFSYSRFRPKIGKKMFLLDC